MSARAFLASTPEELESIFRFRYRIYVEELELQPPEADHERRRLADALDGRAAQYGLLDDAGEVVGSLRCIYPAELDDPRPLIAKFHLEPVIEAFGLEAIVTTSRFMLDPRLRNGLAVLRLIQAAYNDSRSRGVRLNYGDCSPHMLPFYESMGYRRYTPAYDDTIYGFKLPIVMLMGDQTHFVAIRSPFHRVAEAYPEDVEVQDWFARTYPEWLHPTTATMMPQSQFFDLLVERVSSDPLHALELFRGLERRDVERLLASATIVTAEPGRTIVREGDIDDTVYLLLSGLAEVTRGDGAAVAVLGGGDLFGEIGFLTATPRTASVVARAQCEVLVLSGRFLDSFMTREPGIAARVALNLARILAGRLAETTLRVPARA